MTPTTEESTAADVPLGTTRSRLILVSNRLPLRLERDDDRDSWTAEVTAGGLATGLIRPHRESGGCWIGWPGATFEGGALPDDVRTTLARRGMRGVALEPDEHERYYNRVSNGCIWPLFHYFTDRVEFTEEDWSVYVAVNRKFADIVLDEARSDDVVFVQDFHLMLVPAMLREARPDMRIGFFLHIPFPSSEIFRIFPPRARVLRGLLGADLVAFHTLDYVRHFRTSVRRVLGYESSTSEIDVEGRPVRLLAQPLGIEAHKWKERAGLPEVRAEMERLRAAAAGRKILLGVERLDYTKGLPQRLLAFQRLLRDDPSLVERVWMIQVAVPSRVEVETYRDLKDELDRIAGAINSEFGRPGVQPLHYQFWGVPPEHLSALYQVADVAVVTPLRDGLNLVAKEYVASRTADDGVLVLGEFTGAAWELGEALQVNPFDPEALTCALKRALAMSADEQARRMAPMRERVARNDVHVWTRECLRAITRSPKASSPRLLVEADRLRVEREFRGAISRRLFLDYDGTLRPFTPRPDEARPSERLLDLLRRLAHRRQQETWVVSGRPSDVLAEWLGETGVGLVSEHGALVRVPFGREFRHEGHPTTREWRGAVRSIMAQFTDRVPGSLIEEKPLGLAWHYREADRALSTWQARELFQHLVEVLAGQGLEVLSGAKVIEVRPAGVSKGTALRQILASSGEPSSFVLVAGDDNTDETMFRAAPPGAWTLLVGERPSEARHRLGSPEALLELLDDLSKTD